MAPALDPDRKSFGPMHLGDPQESVAGFTHPGLEVECIGEGYA
jgi:hypothetical protein